MTKDLRAKIYSSRLWIWGIIAVVLIGAFVFGLRTSRMLLVLSAVGIGAFVLLQQPILGLPVLAAAALFGRLEIGTGTAVILNPTLLLVPALLAGWVLGRLPHGELRLAPSRMNRPLLLFLAAGLLSLVIGLATWDPAVPRSSSFTIVQLAQWAIFAFAAGAFWLTGNLVSDVASLRRLAFTFLAVAGSLGIVRVFVGLTGNVQLAQFVSSLSTATRERAPFWMLLTALATGQLLFNKSLTTRWRVFLWAVLAASAIFTLHLARQTVSNWAGVVAVVGVLAWLRWPRLRWPVILLLAALALSGTLSSAVYSFGGGDEEWASSGGSRLVLIARVVEVTLRNPITGLGPAAYRPYAGMEPLLYGRAYWMNPQINSHNNYVDLFSQVGLLGLALFCWFAVEVARLALRLRARFPEGFASGYVNAMLAAGAASLVLMLFADWILPFVYNIGFPGFQASVLVWLFMGGLLALEQIADQDAMIDTSTEHQR